MNTRVQITTVPAMGKDFNQFWSTRVDALDRHLSVNRWVLAAATVLLITYPITQILLPAVLHDIVPDVVRTVLNFV